MVVLDSFSVEVALGGSYHDVVIANGPVGYWPLNEWLASTGARDVSGNNHDGVYVSDSPDDHGHLGAIPHGGGAWRANGSTAYVTMGDVAAFEFTGAFSVSLLFKTTHSLTGYFVSKYWSAGGWYVGIIGAPNPAIVFKAEENDGDNVFTVSTTADGAFNDDEWHHCVCTWDGTSGADKAKVYIDGQLSATATAIAGRTPGTNAARLLFAARDFAGTITNYTNCTLQGVALFDAELSAADVTALYNATQWTDLGDDVMSEEPLTLEYGTSGSGPLNRIASSGTLEFALDNSEFNTAGLVGYYAPLHANVRAGFTFNIPVRVQMTYDGTTRTKFWGRIAVIDPEPGVNASRITRVVAHDYMHALVDTDVRELTAQLNVTDVRAIQLIFEALPVDVQPMALSLDAALDTYDYVFDDLKGGVKTATALKRIIDSGWSRLFVYGDGTVRWLNRAATTNQVIDFNLDDSEILDIESPSDRSQIFDLVRVITHPKSIDAAATSVLFSHPGKEFVPANGGVVERWGDYRNPLNDALNAGGTDMVTPVSGTDFAADSAADGSGTDLTASVTVTADFFSSTVKLTLTNNHATLGAYFVDPTTGVPKLQVRGRGIYDLSPVTSQAPSTGAGSHPITIDLPYQGDGTVGQELADFILAEREAITDPIDSFSINPHKTDTLMRLALDGEPGTLLTATEEQIGLTNAQASIRSVRLELTEGEILNAFFGVTPIVVGFEWILGDPDFSQLGETTVFQ